MKKKRKLKRKFKLSKTQAKAFLATEKGQLWLQQKIEEKNERKRLSRPPPRQWKTRFPFEATINERTVVVDRVDGELVVTYD